MTIFSISTAVVGKIWAIFLFPPRFFAEYDHIFDFHRGGRQNMGDFPVSTAVFCQKWPWGAFPPWWSAKYEDFPYFHRGGSRKMVVLRKTTTVVRQNMTIFTSRTIVAVGRITVSVPRNAKNVPHTSRRWRQNHQTLAGAEHVSWKTQLFTSSTLKFSVSAWGGKRDIQWVTSHFNIFTYLVVNFEI